MTSYVALLRAINVAGHGRMKMSDVALLFSSIGAIEPETYLQSGNVVFSSLNDARVLRARIERALTEQLNGAASALVRTAEQMDQIVEDNPFVSRIEDERHLHVTFLVDEPESSLVAAISVPEGETDEFTIAPLAIYLRCGHGYGDTKITNSFFERKLKVKATTRNWRTVRALAEMTAKRT